MATTTTTTTNSNGTKTTTKYSCDKSSMAYTIIGEDIKADFNFLLPGNDMCNKLDEVLMHLKNAVGVEAFDINGAYKDIQHAYDQVEKEIIELKNGLSTLYNAFITDIDNINAELEVNFGHVAFYKCNKASRTE